MMPRSLDIFAPHHAPGMTSTSVYPTRTGSAGRAGVSPGRTSRPAAPWRSANPAWCALRTLMELARQDERKDGLVQWLFSNKKLNHWKSPRATAEVVYSVAHYLKRKKALGAREDTTVRVGGRTVQYVF